MEKEKMSVLCNKKNMTDISKMINRMEMEFEHLEISSICSYPQMKEIINKMENSKMANRMDMEF